MKRKFLYRLSDDIDIYLDTGSLYRIGEWMTTSLISGITANQTLIRQFLMRNSPRSYYGYVADLVRESVRSDNVRVPVSIPLLSTRYKDCLNEADFIRNLITSAAGQGREFFLKVSVLTPAGNFNEKLISALYLREFNLNITAIFRNEEADRICVLLNRLAPNEKTILSYFNGRIDDTGGTVLYPYFDAGLKKITRVRQLWAGSRNPSDIIYACDLGYDIITVTPDVLNKAADRLDKTPLQFCRETIDQFNKDGMWLKNTTYGP